MRFRSLAFAAAAALLFAIPAHAQTPCVGDCDGNGAVTVDEVITMVNIALGTADLASCLAGDGNSDGDITVDEILTAVNHALTGCPAVVDPTPTATPTPGEPTFTPTPTPTLEGGALGVRRFVLNPQQSQILAVLGPGFEVPIGNFRGIKNGVLGDAYLDLSAGAPDEDGLALVSITDSSDFFIAQAAIANLTICLQPILPAVNAGVVQCNGGLDYSIETSIDRIAGQIGVDGFTAQDCLDIGGTIEGPNQVCASGPVGTECFLNSDCDSAPGADDGLCGLSAGTCPGLGPLGGGAPCNTSADCGGAPCSPVRCTAGKINEPCRNAGDCDTTPEDEDGLCGEQAPNPGGCQGPLMISQIGEDSGPGSLIIAPIELDEITLNGLPLRLSFGTGNSCSGGGAAIDQAFALTTGTARTVIRNFNASPDDLVFERVGENFSCQNWASGSGGRFGLSIPAVNAAPAGLGGDIILGFNFQGR